MVTNWSEIPKFVAYGVPKPECSWIKLPVWLDLPSDDGYRVTTRWDFALRSVDAETIKQILDKAHRRDDRFKCYDWTIRVRVGRRRIFE